ncbi:MAG: hypothetical protein AAGF06_06670 [Pseudomonadota bacterium]
MHDIHYVSDNQQLLVMCEALADVDVIAVDTEFVRRKTFYPSAGLFQLGTSDTVYLVDPLTIDAWQPLCAILQDPQTMKVMHACWEDLEVFHHCLGVMPVNVLDTQLALAFCNIGWNMGYHNMVETLLEVSLSKAATMTNWLQRPLTDSQLHYAQEDVTFLLTCFEQLRERLVAEQKWDYCVQQNAYLIQRYENGLSGGDYIKKIKSACFLSHKQQHVLLSLLAWRERTTRKKNIPRSWLLDDKSMLAIVERTGNAVDDGLRDFLHSNKKTQSLSKHIEHTITEALNTPEAQWAQRLPMKTRLPKKHPLLNWKACVEEMSNDLSMSGQLLLSKDEFMSNLHADQGDDFVYVVPVDWPAWKTQLVGPRVIEWMQRLMTESNSVESVDV